MIRSGRCFYKGETGLKVKKYIFWGMMIVSVVAANISGCNLMSNEDRMEKAKELLEEKYQEEFDVLEYYGIINIENDEYQVLASAKNNSDILFEARISAEENYLSDEYITAKICRMMEEKMLQNLGGLNGYLKIKIQAVSKNIDSANSKMTIQEYMALKPSNLYAVYLHYSPQNGDVENLYANLQNACQNMMDISGAMELYILEEDKLKEVARYLEDCAILDDQYKTIVSEITPIRIPFKKGIMEVTEEEFKKEVADKL